jgi:hypothetical protein
MERMHPFLVLKRASGNSGIKYQKYFTDKKFPLNASPLSAKQILLHLLEKMCRTK